MFIQSLPTKPKKGHDRMMAWVICFFQSNSPIYLLTSLSTISSPYLVLHDLSLDSLSNPYLLLDNMYMYSLSYP